MKDFFEKCEAAYFSGYPIISDEEYDALVKKWNHQSVGHKVTDGVTTFVQNVFSTKVL